MAHNRHASVGESLKTPHSVSLKVLRLSRPTLATQYSLPNSSALGIAPTASLAYPSSPQPHDSFILSPVLTLPEAFGSAYVGETFSCTLCANNEVNPDHPTRTVSAVRIQADMQTPSIPGGAPLELVGAGASTDAEGNPGPGESLQKMLRFELKEEGNHVLAVTVTYTETTLAGEGKAASGKVRTFRKLYQFIAQQLLSVRTKAGEVGDGKFLLEAQLENNGEGAVSLEDVRVNPSAVYQATSLNWDLDLAAEPAEQAIKPVLQAREVIQVAFLLEEDDGEDAADAEKRKELLTENRRVLGQLAIQWRTALGDRGTLSTGWLTAKQ